MKSPDTRLQIVLAAAILTGLIAVLCYWTTFHNLGWSYSTTVWGTFGDFVGGVIGTIFNLVGVVLIYLTFRTQTKNSNLQQFESTFFSLLANQRDIVKNLSGIEYNYSLNTVGKTEKPVHGGEYIELVSKRLKHAIDKIKFGTPKAELLDLITEAYDNVYDGREEQLDHYFRHLYHIVKYTNSASIEEEDRRKYVDIVQAQMSDNELYLAFYNGIGRYGREKFLPLMDKYQFIENARSRGEAFEEQKSFFYPLTYAHQFPTSEVTPPSESQAQKVSK